MLVLLDCFPDYDPRKQGTPWGVPCDSSGAPFFKGNAAYFSGGHGTGGCLYAEDPPEGSVWVYGQKDYRLGYTPKNILSVTMVYFIPYQKVSFSLFQTLVLRPPVQLHGKSI